MIETHVKIDASPDHSIDVPVRRVQTLVVGSGAAGLNAAVQLHANGVSDVLILTEGLKKGTSINTGSDKQTYYKLGLFGSEGDSPVALARTLFDGGAHGDLALVEAALSPRGFFNLVNLGVPFPRDAHGQFVGYKTDHDPSRRATSIGPYTSKRMCEALIAEVERRQIDVVERRDVVSLLVQDEGDGKRAVGAVAVNRDSDSADPAEAFEIYLAADVILAVGGPGGLYETSVYPTVHTGAIGLGLLAGAKARNLQESQFGLASIKFRWNVSGSYMQVIPKLVSVDADGSNPSEFLRPYFDSVGAMNSAVFLKGYQWPFDSEKVIGGSSLIDVLVHIETVEKGRRVFLDFTANPEGYKFEDLSEEAREYLEKSNAVEGAPIDRLAALNEPAIWLYADHSIDLRGEPLEVAVCAQHNNGGLAGDLWWRSENVDHLFPIGEVNGSHGVRRPGGSALNAGQVAGFRVAEFIANRPEKPMLNQDQALENAKMETEQLISWLSRGKQSTLGDWRAVRNEFQTRMSTVGAHVRAMEQLTSAVEAAWRQSDELNEIGCGWNSLAGAAEALRNRHLCHAHAVYLDAIAASVKSGVGSRGSGMILSPDGVSIHPKLPDHWRLANENMDFRNQILETEPANDKRLEHHWIKQRPIPDDDAWFETVWAAFRNGEIYQ